MKTCIHVAIKTNNKRLPGKTFKLLGGKPLYQHLFEVLKDLGIDVFVDSSDKEILEISSNYGFNCLERPEEYNQDHINGDQLLERAVPFLEEYDLIGTLFITSPFLKKSTIEKAISLMENSPETDSLMGVIPRHNRFWHKNDPINHDPENLIRTQDLVPVHEEVDFYFFRKESFKKYNKRVCGKIKIIEVDFIESIDINDEFDFMQAESLLSLQERGRI